MSRVAKPVKCTEEDVNLLYSIINNPSSSEILRLKVKAILLANSGKEKKTIALELGMREMSVSDWRKKYLQFGVERLYGAERPGRRVGNKPNVRKMIADDVKSRESLDWTVKSFSKEYNTSVYTVRGALADANIKTLLVVN